MDYLSTLGQSLSSTIGGILPGVLGAVVVLIIGLLMASIISRIVRSLFKKTNIDEKIGQKMNLDFNLGNFIAKLVHWVLILFVLLLVLDMMGMGEVLNPLRDMLGQFFGAIPNIIYAGIIGFLGYIIAKLASEATGFVSGSVESFSYKIGFNQPQGLTKILKQLVFIFVFIPILIIALEALNMDAISKPASEMFQTLLNAIPNIIAAGVIIAVFYFVGRYVVTVLTDLLRNMGADTFAARMGFSKVLGETSLSSLIGNIAFFFLMFTGIISGLEKLGMMNIVEILNDVFRIAGRVFFGLIILTAGSIIADIAAKAMSDKGLAPLVRFAVLGIFLAFSLHTMGIAQSIVNMAFGLTLGAVAVAFALSFGLGGREAAGKQMERFFEKWNK